MSFQNDFQILHEDIKRVGKFDQHHINAKVKFSSLKEQILVVIEALYGDTSREYRIVKLTDSPATVIKVMNHIAARIHPSLDKNIAVNI